MSILENVLNSALSGIGQHSIQSGNYMVLVNALMDIVNQHGGLPGLLQKFREHGLGNLVDSWIGSGQNLPVSADQVKNVLGDGILNHLSSATGQDTGSIAQHLSQLLPELVNQFTPHGQLPTGGFDATSALSIIQKMFLKS